MSLARQALQDLDALVALLARPPRLRDISRCRALADALPAMDVAEARPPEDVTEALRATLRDACANGGASHLPPRTLRQAPHVFWHGEPQAVTFPGLLTHFLNVAVDRERWLVRLIEAWLQDFGPDRIGLASVGRTIAARLPGARHPRLSFWNRAHQAYVVFEAEHGPRRIAQALLAGPQGVADVLAQTGMNDPVRATWAYFRACVRALLDALPHALRAPDAETIWARARSVLEAAQPPGKLRFDDMRGETARACLTPFLGGPRPALAHEPIKTFVVRHLGDPRVEPARWTGAGEEATALVRRWLAEATIEAFFALISLRNDDRQWQYRKAFWSACYRKRPDTEFWVVLGDDLARDARTHADLKGSFGTLDGTTAQNQAVLLIRIGDTVLSEWSNVGYLRAWDRSSRACPRLYNRRYDALSLRAPSLPFPDAPDGPNGLRHSKPARYLWQGRAARFLAQRTDLHLTQADYACSPT